LEGAIKTTEYSDVRVRWQWLIPVSLFVLAIVVFANTFNHGMMYSWDDNRYLRENHLLRDFSVQGIANIFTQFYFAAYIPVTIFSYWIEFNLWGLHPTGYHIVNVFLHAFNGVLVYMLIDQLLRKRWVAVFAAVLFIVHPTQVESVAWIAERKNLLAMLFTLLAFLAHIRSAEPDAKRGWSVLTWFLYFLAVFSKPTVVGLPVLFAAYDYFWAKMPVRRVIIRAIVPVLIAAAGAILIIVAHDDYGGIKSHRGGSPLGTAAVMMVVVWDYVVALIAPLQLDNFYRYPFSIVSEHPVSVVLGILVVLGTVWIAWKQPLGRPFSLFAIVWIWLVMAPVANIIPIAIERADRYKYFPAVVMYALVGLGLERLWHALKSPRLQQLMLVVVAGVIVFYTFLTIQRNLVWTTEGTLWSDHLVDHPDSETGWLNLGVFYYNEADFANAVPAFERLLEMNPTHFKGNRFMGHINLRQDRFEEAIPYYLRAGATDPNDSITQNYLGLSYFRIGDYANAVEAYRRAIGLDSTLREAYENLGVAALNIGNDNLARQALAVAVERRPNVAEIQSNYCTALANLNLLEEAADACLQAARLENTNGFYLGRVAHLFLQVGRNADALTAAERAVEAAPGSSLSHRVLGDALRVAGRNEEAVRAYRRSLELDPNNRRSREGLDALLAGQ
jgi:tetratricopeptide (TPR) repeat protein